MALSAGEGTPPDGPDAEDDLPESVFVLDFIRIAVPDATMCRNAANPGKRIRADAGIARAVAIIERNR
jgi:hypothetical protein